MVFTNLPKLMNYKNVFHLCQIEKERWMVNDFVESSERFKWKIFRVTAASQTRRATKSCKFFRKPW